MPIPTNKPIWKDGQLVKPIDLHNSMVHGTVTVGDFSLAIKTGTSVEFKYQSPTIYYAPERVYNKNPDLASDMWSYMCVFAELCIGFSLFRGSAHPSLIQFMVTSLGPLLSAWRGSYDGYGKCDES